ncbi:MAG: P-II family nitrogen regulator [Sandaracinaceae bacterium]
MPLPLHPRKKLELIIDRPHLPRYLRLLEQRGVNGYTVLPALGGRGTRGEWKDGGLTDAADRVVVVAVLSEPTLEVLMLDLDALFEDFPGIVFVSDVEVLRAERFG